VQRQTVLFVPHEAWLEAEPAAHWPLAPASGPPQTTLTSRFNSGSPVGEVPIRGSPSLAQPIPAKRQPASVLTHSSYQVSS
jgi:hypothetical protein